uniref:YqaJ viral recombinase domain-containing protein n=1 Tax=Sinocyclocheilus grahami TaxID=75366 RepID=A0A672LW45_SINGR
MAGVAESCTHVGALLFKVEATARCSENATVTERPAYWMLPSNINKVYPEVGHKINYTSAVATRRSLNSLLDGETHTRPALRTCSTKTPPRPPTPEEMAKFYSDLYNTGARSAILSVLPHYCEDFKDPIQPIRNLKSLTSIRNTSLDGSDFSTLQQHCQTIISTADVSEGQAAQIERRTRGQHNSSLWFAARAGRITASCMHHVYATDINSPALSTVKKVCYPKHGPETADTTWGIRQEENARKAYISKTRGQHTFPQIGASPDAIVRCTCCGKGCIEIKCPSKYKDCTILNACSSNDTNFCLQLVDGQVHLRKGHQYYSQVQMQIFVTDSAYCDFVVWTLKDCVVVRITPDTEFEGLSMKISKQSTIAATCFPNASTNWWGILIIKFSLSGQCTSGDNRAYKTPAVC